MSDITDMQLRIHSYASNPAYDFTFEYYRDSAWTDLTSRVVVRSTDGNEFPVRVSKPYRGMYSAELTLDNSDGLLTREDRESALNLNGASEYDPLMDEARKVRLKQGIYCYGLISDGITPTVDTALDGGVPARLTDNTFGTVTDETDVDWCYWTAVASEATRTVTIDLGSAQTVRHGMISFLSMTSASPQIMLPSTVQFQYSTNGTDWTNIGSAFDLSHYKNSISGQRYLAYFNDCDRSARYVRAVITNIAEENEIYLDEFSVWGGATADTQILKGTFCGYLGDDISAPSKEGYITVRFQDVRKKEQDNNRVPVTLEYRDKRPEEIIYDLLTNESYWSSAETEGTNLVTDPSFELGTHPGWTAASGGTRKSTKARTGTYCIELDQANETLTTDAGAEVPVTAGDDYLWEIWVYSPPVAAREFHLTFTFDDPSATVQRFPTVGNYEIGSTSYVRLAGRFTAPAGATGFTFLVTKDTGGDGDWRVDDVTVKKVSSTATIPYDSVLDSSEIGWAHDDNLSDFKITRWQGRGKSILGYINELADAIGWVYDADGDGTRQFWEPEYNRTTAHSYCNYFGSRQTRGPVRKYTGKDMINSLELVGYEGGNTEVPRRYRHEASIARYGVRHRRIVEPLIRTADHSDWVAKAFFRDFAYAGSGLESEVVGDFDVERPYRIYSHNEEVRVALKKASHANAELWAMWGYETEMCTAGPDYGGYYRASYEGRQYMSSQPDPVADIAGTGGNTNIAVAWTANTEADIDGYYVYWASGDSPSDWDFTKRTKVTAATDTITGLSNGNAYWIYVTAVNIGGIESEPSAIIRCLAGVGNSGDEDTTWGIASLSAALTDNDPTVVADLSWTPSLDVTPDYITVSLAGPHTSATPTYLTEQAKITPVDSVAHHYYATYRRVDYPLGITMYWRLALREVVILDKHYKFGAVLYSAAASAAWPS